MKISVVVPTRNRYENLKNTIAALTAQTLDKELYEIIISDDNSDDNTFEIYKEIRSACHAKYVNNNTKPHSWNASIPRNLGALVSDPEAKTIVFVDSDVLLPPTALAHYLEDYEKNSKRVVVGSYDFWAEGNQAIQVADVRDEKFKSVSPEDTFDKVTDGLACFGGNIMFPKKIFWEVSGYSVDIHIGLEDGEMGIKLWKLGAKISYDDRVRGKHQWHETPPDRFPPDMKDHIDYLNKKHFNTISPDYGIIEASRDAYKSWGITGWQPPKEWLKMGFMMKVNKK